MKQINRIRAWHDDGREVKWLQIGKLAIVKDSENGSDARLHYAFRTQPGTATEYAMYAEHLREQGFETVEVESVSLNLGEDFNELKFKCVAAHDSRDVYTIYEFGGFIAVAEADNLGVFHAESAAEFLKRQFHGAYEFEEMFAMDFPSDAFTELAIRYEDLEYRYNCVLRELGEIDISDEHLARLTAVKHAHFAAIDGDFAEIVIDMFCDMHTYADLADEAEALQRDYLCLTVEQTAEQTAGARERLDYALGRLTCGDEPLQEMGFVANRLAELDSDEVDTLCALIKIHTPEDIKTLINLSYHLDDVVLAGGIADTAALGVFLVESGMVELYDPSDPNPNYVAIGESRLRDYCSAIIDGIYYEDLEPNVREVYDGVTLPVRREVAEVEIRNKILEKGEVRTLTEHIKLPCSDAKLCETLTKLLLDEITENGRVDVKWVNSLSELQSLSGECRIVDNLCELNHLTEQISVMGADALAEFRSLTKTYLTDWPTHDMPMPEKTLANALYLTGAAGGSPFIHGIKDHATLGKYCIKNGLIAALNGLNESIIECLDYDKVGRLYCKGLNWHIHDDCFIYDLPTREQLRFPSEIDSQITVSDSDKMQKSGK